MATDLPRCANCQHWIQSLLDHRAGFGVCTCLERHNAHEVYTAALDTCGSFQRRMTEEERRKWRELTK